MIGERLADLVAIADDDTVDAGLVLAECARQLRALAGKPDPVAALSRDRPSDHSPRKPPLAGTREICADHRMRGANARTARLCRRGIFNPIADVERRDAAHTRKGRNGLTQLEQLTASFRVSTGSGLSRIKGLGWAEG